VAQLYPPVLGSLFVASYDSQDRFRFRLFCDRRSVGHSVLVSGPNLGPMTRFFITVGNLRSSCCGTPSLTGRRVCNLLVQFAVTLGSKSRRTHGHILLSHLILPQPGGPSPLFISHRNRVAQLYPRALGSSFVASYDSQGYGGGILTCLTLQF
jgi:hypothetical protein